MSSMDTTVHDLMLILLLLVGLVPKGPQGYGIPTGLVPKGRVCMDVHQVLRNAIEYT